MNSIPAPTSMNDATDLVKLVAHLVSQFPSGAACLPSASAMHRFMGEFACSFLPASGEVLSLAVPGDPVVKELISQPEVSWHFTDLDGEVHVTISGTPHLFHRVLQHAVPQLSDAHRAAMLEEPGAFQNSDVLVTLVKTIRFEVPTHELVVVMTFDSGAAIEDAASVPVLSA